MKNALKFYAHVVMAALMAGLPLPAVSQTAATRFNTDTVQIGRKSSVNKQLQFNTATGTATPMIRSTTTGLQFSNDGTNFSAFGTGSGGASGYNALTINPEFEQGLNGWTNSGGTLAAVTAISGQTVNGGANSALMIGTGSAIFTASAASQYVSTVTPVTIGSDLAGMQCSAGFSYLGGDANLRLSVTNVAGTEIVGRQFTAAATSRLPFLVTWPCGVAGTQYHLRLASTAAAAAVAIDKMYLGEATVLPFIDAVPLKTTTITTAGTSTFTPQASTRWMRVRMVGAGGGGAGSGSAAGGSGGSASASTFGTSLLTANGGVAGNSGDVGGTGGSATISAPATGVALTGAAGMGGRRAPVAEYNSGAMGGNSAFGGGGAGIFTGAGLAGATNTGAGGASGGDNNTTGIDSGGAGGAGGFVDAIIVNPASSYPYTLAAGGTGGTAGTGGYAGGAGAVGEIIVDEFGYAGGQAYPVSTLGWRVDANLSDNTLNPSLGTVTVGSYAEITSTTTSLVQNAGSASVGIACANGTASVVGATTCAGGRSVGITFNQPAPGTDLICASFTHYLNMAVSSSIATTFEVMGTTASSSAFVTEGGTRIHDQANSAAGAVVVQAFPQRVCGTFNIATAGQQTFRLEYTQLVTGTATNSQILMDGSTSYGRRDVHFEVYPINQSMPMPVLMGPYAQTSAAKTTNYTLVPSDDIVSFDTTSGNLTGTLFTAVGNLGKVVRIAKPTYANMLTVNTTSGQTIGDVTSTILYAKGDSITVYSDGANWQWLSDPERTASVLLTCGSSGSTISYPNGAWLTSIANGGSAGNCTINIPAGMFSLSPYCSCLVSNGSSVINTGCYATAVATTAVTFQNFVNGALANTTDYVACHGKR